MRLANLKSGRLDFIERVSPLRSRRRSRQDRSPSSPRSSRSDIRASRSTSARARQPRAPLGRDPRVREAFELAHRSRRARPGRHRTASSRRQSVGPARTIPTTPRRAGAEARSSPRPRRCCRRRASNAPSSSWCRPTPRRAGRAGRAGDGRRRPAFDVKIRVDRVRHLARHGRQGRLRGLRLGWSGRADPDGNIYSFDACKRPAQLQRLLQPEVDELLDARATTLDPGGRARTSTRRSPSMCSRTGRSCTSITMRNAAVCAIPTSVCTGFAPHPDGARSALAAGSNDCSEQARGCSPIIGPPIAASSFPTLFFVSMLIFGLQQLLPGDPALILAGEERDPQVIALSAPEISPRRAAAGALPLLGSAAS